MKWGFQHLVKVSRTQPGKLQGICKEVWLRQGPGASAHCVTLFAYRPFPHPDNKVVGRRGACRRTKHNSNKTGAFRGPKVQDASSHATTPPGLSLSGQDGSLPNQPQAPGRPAGVSLLRASAPSACRSSTGLFCSLRIQASLTKPSG